MAAIDLQQVYRDYYPNIKRYVGSKVGDLDCVEDIVSDIFIKVTEHLDRYDETKASLSTWIYTIASRTVLDYYRLRKISVPLPTESGEEGSLPLELVDTGELDADLLREEQLQNLADALSKLSKRDRDIIILHYYNKIQLKDIAAQMHMSYANIKVVHKKALKKLRQEMEW